MNRIYARRLLKFRGILLACCGLFGPLAGWAQAPAWQSVRTVAVATAAPSYSNESQVIATAPDGAGNVYMTGSFRGTVTLGNLTLTTASTDQRMFVAKWLPASATYAWAVQTDARTGNALAVQGSSVFVGGEVNGSTATFGSTTLTYPNGRQGGFVAKLTDAGASASFTWALPVYAQAGEVAVSGPNVYVAGSFNGTATFGSTTLTNIDSSLYPDAYLAKIADAGATASYGWARSTGVVGSEDLCSAVAAAGSVVYVTGRTSAAMPVFGSPAALPAGMFVARLTDTGSSPAFGWVASVGDNVNAPNSGTGASAIALSGTRLYLTGSIQGSVSFGATTLVSSTNSDGYVARLNDTGTSGTFAWATRCGAGPEAIAASNSNVYVAGAFYRASVAFGSTVLTNSDPVNFSNDAFVAKVTDAGTSGPFVWAKSAGGAGNTGTNPSRDVDNARALALSGNTVFVAGRTYSATASFAPLTLTNPTGNAVGFLATLTDPTLTASRSGLADASPTPYPNPARGTATVRWPSGQAQPLTIFDALGREVRRYPAPTAAETTLDLHGLPAGLYVLRCGSSRQQLVVE